MIMWLPYSDTYDVSEDGQVRNSKTERILKQCLDNKDRFIVDLYHNGIGKTIPVHRLVALRFLPKIDLPKLDVDHIDRNKQNNNASNLRWCSKSCNSRNKPAKNICKCNNGFQVRFGANHQQIYYKYFKTIEEAIVARDVFKASEQYLTIS